MKYSIWMPTPGSWAHGGLWVSDLMGADTGPKPWHGRLDFYFSDVFQRQLDRFSTYDINLAHLYCDWLIGDRKREYQVKETG